MDYKEKRIREAVFDDLENLDQMFDNHIRGSIQRELGREEYDRLRNKNPDKLEELVNAGRDVFFTGMKNLKKEED